MRLVGTAKLESESLQGFDGSQPDERSSILLERLKEYMMSNLPVVQVKGKKMVPVRRAPSLPLVNVTRQERHLRRYKKTGKVVVVNPEVTKLPRYLPVRKVTPSIIVSSFAPKIMLKSKALPPKKVLLLPERENDVKGYSDVVYNKLMNDLRRLKPGQKYGYGLDVITESPEGPNNYLSYKISLGNPKEEFRLFNDNRAVFVFKQGNTEIKKNMPEEDARVLFQVMTNNTHDDYVKTILNYHKVTDLIEQKMKIDKLKAKYEDMNK